MQFGSRQKRNTFTAMVLGLVPDVLISAIAAAATDSGVMGFFVVLVGLQVVYVLIWLKNLIWEWFLFLIRGRKQATEHLFDYLRSHSYPEPDDYHDNVEGYLSGVMVNEQQPVDVRLNAAVEVGALNLMRSTGQTSQLLVRLLVQILWPIGLNPLQRCAE